MKKQFLRSKKDRVVAGVCGGIAEYTSWDVKLIRFLSVIIILITGWAFLLYVLLWLLIPQATNVSQIKTTSLIEYIDNLEKTIKSAFRKK